MNMELLGDDITEAFQKSALEGTDKLMVLTGEKRDFDIGGVLESGFTAAGNVLSAFFGYKTQQIKSGGTDPNRTAYTPPADTGNGKDNTKTIMIVGGTALAAIVAFAALK